MFSKILVTGGGNHDSFAHLRYEYPFGMEIDIGSELEFYSREPGVFTFEAKRMAFHFGCVDPSDSMELVLGGQGSSGYPLATTEEQHFKLIDSGWKVDTKSTPFMSGEPNLIIDGQRTMVDEKSIELITKLLKRQGCSVEVMQ